MSGNALPTDGRFRFVASDRTGRPWITLFVLRGVHVMGTGSDEAVARAGCWSGTPGRPNYLSPKPDEPMRDVRNVQAWAPAS